jgi:hypothetical protein
LADVSADAAAAPPARFELLSEGMPPEDRLFAPIVRDSSSEDDAFSFSSFLPADSELYFGKAELLFFRTFT